MPELILLILSLLISSVIHADHACSTNYDCSLNGICNVTSSECICDDEWYGEYCDLLNILPTIKNNGYRETNYSSWGGSIIYDSKTDSYNMFVARMSMHCGLTTWKTNSEIVHAISKNKNPLGPYIFNKVVLPRFAHNPSIYLFNNTYYLYHIGCGHNSTIPVKDCINGTTPKTKHFLPSNYNTAADSCDGPHWTGVLYSDNNDINGEWKDGLNEITLITNHSKNYTTNPAPYFIWNGTIYFVYRQPAALWPYVYPPNATSERLGMSISYNLNFAGPFLDLSPFEPIQNYPLEDPYLWIDFRGNFHMMTHKKKPNYGPNDGSAGHLFSEDGLNWNISRNSPFNNSIIYNDGTFEQVTSRERPQLIIKNGRIRYVSSGVKFSYNTGDYTFTIVQPVYSSSK